jgi:hypothetical protein
MEVCRLKGYVKRQCGNGLFMKTVLMLGCAILSASAAWGEPSIEWEKSYGGSGIDIAYSVQQTGDGGYIVAGYSESNDGMCSETTAKMIGGS